MNMIERMDRDTNSIALVISSRQRFLTLMEFLIVLGLLSIVAGFFAIRIKSAVQEQLYRSEVQQVTETIRLAQDIMLLLHTDTTLTFVSEGKGIRMSLETTTPISGINPWPPRPHILKGIHYVEMSDDTNPNKIPGKLELRFFSDGLVMSEGILRLGTFPAQTEGGLEQFIYFPGHPAPMTSVAKAEDAKKQKAFELEESQRLTSLTTNEVRQINQ